MKIQSMLLSTLCLGMSFAAPVHIYAEEVQEAGVYTVDSELNKLQNQESTLKKELDAARKKQQEAQNTLDRLQSSSGAVYGQSALDFYNWLYDQTGQASVKQAAEVVADKTGATQNNSSVQISQATNIGAQGDATSLENLERAVNMVDTCNALRAKDPNFPNCQPLKISPYLMAVSAKQTNYSRNYVGHCKAYNVGENLAWTWSEQSAWSMWYDEEKAIYDSHGSGVTGHYTNIVNPSYRATGMAISGNCFGHVFDFFDHGYALTTSEMRAKISEFKKTLSSGQTGDNSDAIAKAQKALDDAGKLVQTKEKELQDVQKKIKELGGLPSGDSGSEAELKPGMSVLLKPGQSIGGVSNDTRFNLLVECTQDNLLNFSIVFGTIEGVPTLEELKATLQTQTNTKPESRPQQKPGNAADTEEPTGPGVISAASASWSKENGKWFCTVDGKKLTGNQSIVYGGKIQDYCFLENGEMYTGWRVENDKKVYYVSSGEKKKNGWILLDEKWYAADASGYMRTGWVQDKGDWYYLQKSDQDGKPQGSMLTGWLTEGSESYYLDSAGKAASGWKTLQGASYYFYTERTGNFPANSLARNTWIEGYYVNEKGIWQPEAQNNQTDGQGNTQVSIDFFV